MNVTRDGDSLLPPPQQGADPEQSVCGEAAHRSGSVTVVDERTVRGALVPLPRALTDAGYGVIGFVRLDRLIGLGP